jgi:hypothetical protein
MCGVAIERDFFRSPVRSVSGRDVDLCVFAVVMPQKPCYKAHGTYLHYTAIIAVEELLRIGKTEIRFEKIRRKTRVFGVLLKKDYFFSTKS